MVSKDTNSSRLLRGTLNLILAQSFASPYPQLLAQFPLWGQILLKVMNNNF